jgi:transposase
MKAINHFPQIYLYPQIVDFRKYIDGLTSVIMEKMLLDPFSESIFIFTNKRKNKYFLIYALAGIIFFVKLVHAFKRTTKINR